MLKLVIPLRTFRKKCPKTHWGYGANTVVYCFYVQSNQESNSGFAGGHRCVNHSRTILFCWMLSIKICNIGFVTPKVGAWISAATYPILTKLVHNRANINTFFLSMEHVLRFLFPVLGLRDQAKEKHSFCAPFGPNKSWWKLWVWFSVSLGPHCPNYGTRAAGDNFESQDYLSEDLVLRV